MLVNDAITSIIKGVWGDEPLDNEKNVPVIKTNNMTYEGHLNLNEITYRYFGTDVSNSYLRKGDLLVEKSGGTKTHSVGYINIFEGNEKTYVANNFILILRPNQNFIRPKYLFYQLKHKYESGEIRNCYNQTTGIQNLKVSSYLNKHIVCEDFKTQDAQLVVLDSISSEISKQNKLIFYYNALIKSRFNEMFGNVIENPKGWVVKYLSEICDVRDGTHESPKYLQNGYIFITSKNITNGSLDFDDIKYISYDDFCKIEKRSHVNNGDILMPMIGTIGGAVIVNKDREFAIKNVCLIKFLKNSTVTNLYIQNVLNSEEMIGHLQEIKKGGIQSFIGLNTIRNLKIPVPPIVLQKSFASFVKQVNKLKFNCQERIKLYQELLDKKMDEYFG